MAKGIGRLFQLGIAKETTRGTAETAATFWIPWSEISLDEKDTKILDEQTRGVIEDSVGMSIVKQWAEGTLKAPIGDKHFGLILLAAFGLVTTTDNPDVDPSVKDHTFSVQQNAQHQSLTLFADDPIGGQDYTHALGVLTQLEISYELGKFLEYTAQLKAKKGAAAILTPATTTENRFLPQHLTFKTASNLAGLGTAAATKIRSLTLRIIKNIEDDDVLGSISPNDFLNKQLAIEGTLEAIFQNESDFKNDFLSGTSKAMRLDLKNTDVTIGTAANPQLTIDLAKVTFTELTRAIRLNDVVLQTVAFKAHYSTGDSKIGDFKLTNTQAAY